MYPNFPEKVDLRAHHLYGLVRQHRSPELTRAIKKFKLKLLGYERTNLAKHIIDTNEAIIQADIKQVRIVNTNDVICGKCAQGTDKYCSVAGKNWPVELLSHIDDKIAKNSGLKIGETYDSTDLVERLESIRAGIRKTFLDIPTLKEMALLIQSHNKD